MHRLPVIRLLGEFTGQTDELFTYDENGNRLTSGSTVTYTTSDHNRILFDGAFTSPGLFMTRIVIAASCQNKRVSGVPAKRRVQVVTRSVSEGFTLFPSLTLRVTNDPGHAYDAEGNHRSKTEIATGDVIEYSWNQVNQLTAVTNKDSNNTVTKSVTYRYDALDRRIGKSVDATGDGIVDCAVGFFCLVSF